MAETNPYEGYLAKIKGVESKGKATAKNPNSSASGLYQFTKGTWEGLGYNWQDRFNPTLQKEAATKLTDYNARYLKKKLGIAPTDADLYGAHFMGPTTYAKLYKTSDTTPISFVLSSGAINANKSVVYDNKGRLKTVGEIRQWLTKKMNTPVSEDMYTKSNIFSDPNQDFNYNRDPLGSAYTDDEEADKEAEDAKQELIQKQSEKNFLAEAQTRFALAQQTQEPTQVAVPQADPSLYQLPQIALPEYGQTQVMQEGGQIDPVKQWTLDYINSPKYKERLKGSGYEDVAGEVKNRAEDVKNTDISYNRLGTLESLMKLRMPADPTSHFNKDIVNLDYTSDIKYLRKAYPDLKLPSKKEILAHEISHGETAFGGGDNRMNDYDVRNLEGRGMHVPWVNDHDKEPSENKADLNAFRYLLKQQGIYDAGKETFTKEHLKKAKDTFTKGRLKRNYSDKSLIWLMNHVAQTDNQDNNIQYVKNGGTIQPKFTK